MNVTLPVELEQMVKEKVESGEYRSAGEVVRDALQLLYEREHLRRLRQEELKREIQIGLDQLDRGESAPLDIEAIKAEARANLQSGG